MQIRFMVFFLLHFGWGRSQVDVDHEMEELDWAERWEEKRWKWEKLLAVFYYHEPKKNPTNISLRLRNKKWDKYVAKISPKKLKGLKLYNEKI